MELRQLKYFLKAKELLNFTDAANSLFISQSTLSQQIKQLENDLGTQLFHRVGKRVFLTEAGELFSQFALQSVNKATEGLFVVKDLNNLKSGTISIGLTYALRKVLTQTITIFAKEYPQINLKIIFGTTDELIEKLNNFELDQILTFKEATTDQNLVYEKLFNLPMVLVASKNSPICKRKSISFKEICNLPLILPVQGYKTTQFVSDQFKKRNLNPNVLVEINDIATLIELVKTGNWYSILTQISASDEGTLTIPIKDRSMNRTAVMISLKGIYKKKSLMKFNEILLSLNYNSLI